MGGLSWPGLWSGLDHRPRRPRQPFLTQSTINAKGNKMNKYIVSFFDNANGWWDEITVEAKDSDAACTEARKIMGKGFRSFSGSRA
jgi:hypothetical protein